MTSPLDGLIVLVDCLVRVEVAGLSRLIFSGDVPFSSPEGLLDGVVVSWLDA
jgi:hypothetical protein